MNKFLLWLVNPPTEGPKSTLLLRLMAGGVFFWEGLSKFVYVSQGVGRFTKLGIPFPHFTAVFIGHLEIVGGLWLLTGLMTRLIDGIIGLAPGALKSLAAAFGTPLLSGVAGPVTQFLLNKLTGQ